MLRSLALLFVVLTAACANAPVDTDIDCSEEALCPAGWRQLFDGNNPYCPFEDENCVERVQCGREYKCVPEDCPPPRCEPNEVQIPSVGGGQPSISGTRRSACGLSIECAACSGPATCEEGEVAIEALDPRDARYAYCSGESSGLYWCQDEAECFSCGDPNVASGPACTDDEGTEECVPRMCGAEPFGCRPVVVCEDVTCEDQTSEVVEIAPGPCEEQFDRCVNVACGVDEQVQCTTLCRTGASIISGPAECPMDEYCEVITHMDEDVWCGGGALDPECDEPPVCEDGDTAGAASEPCESPDTCYYRASCGQVTRCERP